jgi:ElaB/YqjD/DUF883 family membrane-anchored ribosome-binding protein
MTDMTADQRDKLVQDLKLVIADAEELLHATAGQAGEGAKEMRARVQERLHAAKTNLIHMQEVAAEKARAATRATDNYVHDNPWKAIGAAAGVGLLLGLLIGRR